MIKYAGYVVHKPIFYKMLYIVIDMCLKVDGKVLMYIGTIDSILHIYNSSIPKEEKDFQLEKKFILTTTKSCGAAMDIKGLKATVLLAEPFKSEALARQTLGRTRDENTSYIELVDTGFGAIRNYYYKKLKVFNKYATKCSNILLNDRLIDDKYTELYWKYNERTLDYLEEMKKGLPKVFHHIKKE